MPEAEGFWWRPSRAAGAGSSWPTASGAAGAPLLWACCLPAGWSVRATGRSVSSAPITSGLLVGLSRPDIPILSTENRAGRRDLEECGRKFRFCAAAFRSIAMVAQMIERPRAEDRRTTRGLMMNADLIYDVLRRHEPDHVLLRHPRRGCHEVDRHRPPRALLAAPRGGSGMYGCPRVSPLAVPALVEEGREWVPGGARDALLAEAAALVAETTDGAHSLPLRPPICRRRSDPPARIARPRLTARRPQRSAFCAPRRGGGRAAQSRLHLTGERLGLCPSGVAVWPARRADRGGSASREAAPSPHVALLPPMIRARRSAASALCCAATIRRG